MRPRAVLTGGTGFLGKHVTAAFKQAGWDAIPLGRKDGDLRDPAVIRALLGLYHPEAVIHLAANCGGIGANMKAPADFYYDNALMGLNVVHECSRHKGIRLVVAGTVCAYPKHTPVPFREEALWDGYPEETNAPYGVAKKSLAVMLDAYRQQHGLDGCYLLPVNLYGPGDNFDPETSHVIPALIRKVAYAQKAGRGTITLWGTGSATRDFLHARDAARAFVIAAEKQHVVGPFNLGSGQEVSIKELAGMVAELCGWDGAFAWDASKPDGQPRRVLDSSKAAKELGWRAQISLQSGLESAISWWKANRAA